MYEAAQHGHSVALTLTGNDQVAEGPDESRCAIVVPTLAHALSLSFGVAATAASFQCAAGVAPFVLRRYDLGDLLTAEVHVKGTLNDTVTLLMGQQ